MAKKEAKTDGGQATEVSGKNQALNLAMEQIEKQFGRGAIMRMDGGYKLDVETISTGSLSLDLALGGGEFLVLGGVGGHECEDAKGSR